MVDQNLDQQSSDAMNSVENALSSLWDKAREASLLISTLREEKKRLIQRVAELDEEIIHLKANNAQKDSQIEQLRTEAVSDAGKKLGAINIDLEEKRILQQKIRTIIAKLDQYITS